MNESEESTKISTINSGYICKYCEHRLVNADYRLLASIFIFSNHSMTRLLGYAPGLITGFIFKKYIKYIKSHDRQIIIALRFVFRW